MTHLNLQTDIYHSPIEARFARSRSLKQRFGRRQPIPTQSLFPDTGLDTIIPCQRHTKAKAERIKAHRAEHSHKEVENIFGLSLLPFTQNRLPHQQTSYPAMSVHAESSVGVPNTAAPNAAPSQPQQGQSQRQKTSSSGGGNTVNYIGYLLESFACSTGIKDHLRADVMENPHRMLSVGLTLLDTLVQPSNRDIVRAARELPYDEYRFFYERDLEAEEIRSSVPRYWLSLFAVSPPDLRLGKYLVRLTNSLRCDIDCFVMGLCLLRRVVKSGFPICSRSIHRLFLATSVVAAKMRDDKYYPTSFYADIGGVRKSDIEAMEVSLLNILQFDAGVSSLEYVDMLYSLRVHCAGLAFAQGQEWAQRAWEELISCVRYPDRDLFGKEIMALADAQAYRHTTTFFCELPTHLRSAQPSPQSCDPAAPHMGPRGRHPVGSAAAVEDSMSDFPRARGDHAAGGGGGRPILHVTPFNSISNVLGAAGVGITNGRHPHHHVPTPGSSHTNLMTLAADSVSMPPIQFQHLPHSSAHHRAPAGAAPSNKASVSVNQAMSSAAAASASAIVSPAASRPDLHVANGTNTNNNSANEDSARHHNSTAAAATLAHSSACPHASIHADNTAVAKSAAKSPLGSSGHPSVAASADATSTQQQQQQQQRMLDVKGGVGAFFGPRPGDSMPYVNPPCLGQAVLRPTPNNSIGDIASSELFSMPPAHHQHQPPSGTAVSEPAGPQ